MKNFVAKKTISRIGKERSEGEDIPITKKELRHFLHNRREVNDFMWDVDAPFNVDIMAKPYPTRYQLDTNWILLDLLLLHHKEKGGS